MPVIEYNSDGERFQLKNAPPDGFIVARALTYEEILTRRDLAAKFIYRQKENDSGKTDKELTAEDIETVLESSNSVVQKFQFAKQILDHNLMLPNNRKFNFADPRDLKRLPPKLGTEIEILLDKLNEDEADEDTFTEQSSTSSESEPTTSLEEKLTQPIGSI